MPTMSHRVGSSAKLSGSGGTTILCEGCPTKSVCERRRTWERVAQRLHRHTQEVQRRMGVRPQASEYVGGWCGSQCERVVLSQHHGVVQQTFARAVGVVRSSGAVCRESDPKDAAIKVSSMSVVLTSHVVFFLWFLFVLGIFSLHMYQQHRAARSALQSLALHMLCAGTLRGYDSISNTRAVAVYGLATIATIATG